jgi:hypothetical protein
VLGFTPTLGQVRVATLMLFFSLPWKCGRRRGEMGTFFFGNIFFIVEWLGRGRGFFFFTNSLWGEESSLG